MGVRLAPKRGRSPSPRTKAPRFKVHFFEPFDLATLPPREWLYGKHYQRRTVSATIAPGGFGKTSLCMVEAVAMATARNLLGEQPSERLRVWYHNGEDSKDDSTAVSGLSACITISTRKSLGGGWP